MMAESFLGADLDCAPLLRAAVAPMAAVVALEDFATRWREAVGVAAAVVLRSAPAGCIVDRRFRQPRKRRHCLPRDLLMCGQR